MSHTGGIDDGAAGTVSPCADAAALRRRRLMAGLRALLALGLAALAVLALNLFGWLKLQSAQLDVTEERLFTITPATQRVLRGLKEPVILRFYRSRALAERAAPYAAHGARIIALLREYERRAPGLLEVEVVEPQPFSEREDEAIAAGLQPVPLPDGGNAWFGLVGENMVGRREVLPFLPVERAPLLEYDLTLLVHRLGMARRPVVGVLSDLPMFGGMRPDGRRGAEWAVIAQLRELFEVRRIGGDAGAVKKALRQIDVLLVATPVRADAATWRAVEAHLRRGGAAVMMVDPYTEAVMGDVAFIGRGALKADDPLLAMLRRLGVTVRAGRFVADPAFARRVVFADDAGRRREAPWLAWLELNGDAFSAAQRQLFINVPTMNLGSAGALRLVRQENEAGDGEAAAASAAVRLEPVIAASERARLLDVKLLFPPDPLKLLAAYGKAAEVAGEKGGDDAGERPWLAAWVRGEVRGAAAAGSDGRAAGDATDGGEGGQRTAALKLLLVGDSDLLADRFWARLQDIGGGRKLVLPLAGNATFLLNALARLSGGEVLEGLSGRMLKPRPFTRVEALRAAAERQYRQREQALTEKLRAAQRKLAGLAAQVRQGNVTISARDRQELQQVRAEILQLRRALRDVQQALARDIRRLEFRLKALNIAGPVLLVVVPGLLGFGWRRWRARARTRAARLVHGGGEAAA